MRIILMNHPGVLSHEVLHDLFGGVVDADIYEQCLIRGTGGWS